MQKNALADNLRLLCSYKKSISEVCRELNINRQQFNKYLGAKTTPSGNNLRKICDYFGVEEHEITLPHEEFEALIKVKPQRASSSDDPLFDCLDKLGSDGTDLSKYVGNYFIYYYSTSFNNSILKSYCSIYKDAERYYIKWIERLSKEEASSHNDFVYKIKGVVNSLGNRIFISGYEQVLQNEMVHITLYPTYKNKVSLLSGLLLGVSGTDSREPVCQRVVLSYLGQGNNHRKAMKECGIFDADSPQIDPQIRRHIDNQLAPNEQVLFARPL
ncbi:MAG: helix-turn-helix domain-containing protein [Pseudomonadales bacterium]